MKRSLIASAALAVLGMGMASAADLPVAPPPGPVYLPPAFTWTGVYIGGNIGGAWAKDAWTDTLFGLAWNNGTNSGRFIAGGQAGINYQIASFVVGVEGDYDWLVRHIDSITVAIPPGANIQVASGDNWISTIAARVGFAADRLLIYGKAGAGWIGTDGVEIRNVTTGQSLSNSSPNTLSGWVAGAGLEWAVTPNWTVKAEYDYLRVGGRSLTVPATAIPVLAGDTFTSGNRNVQLVKFGFNYLFNWGAPIAARY